LGARISYNLSGFLKMRMSRDYNPGQYAYLLKRWINLCRRCGVRGDNLYYSQLFYRLAHYYQAPGRYYHVLDHIYDFLKKFDDVKHLIENPDEFEFAIWFHDAIYEFWTRPNENEQYSMELGRFFVIQLMGLSEVLANQVSGFIYYTKHFQKGVHDEVFGDHRYMTDIDLYCGLGRSKEVFERNIELTAREHEWAEAIDPAGFRQRRLEVFKMFAGYSPFYLTEYFQTHHEAQVQENLAAAIRELEAAV